MHRGSAFLTFCIGVLLAVSSAGAANAQTSLRSVPAGKPADVTLNRPPAGAKYCTFGDDRICGPTRSYGPWQVDESLQSPACTVHFCVHWVDRTRDAPHLNDLDGDGAPNFVELVLDRAERSYAVMVGQLGWEPPLPDAGKGGDDRTDFYLFNTDLNTRANALALADRNADQSSGWIILDDDYDDPTFHGDSPKRVLEYFVPHELNHIFQIGYTTTLDAWYYEATAEWMGSVVYPHPQFYAFIAGLPGTSSQPIFRFGYRSYAFSTWNAWLAGRISPDVIRRVWELADSYRRPGRQSTAILDRAIGGISGGSTNFGREFLRYATATAEWSARDFESGQHTEAIQRVGALHPGDGPSKSHLAQSAWALLDVDLDRGAANYTLSVEVKRETPAGIALIGRRGDRVVRAIADLPEGGAGTVTLEAPEGGFRRLTAVLVNTEIRHKDYSKEGGLPGFLAQVSAG